MSLILTLPPVSIVIVSVKSTSPDIPFTREMNCFDYSHELIGHVSCFIHWFLKSMGSFFHVIVIVFCTQWQRYLPKWCLCKYQVITAYKYVPKSVSNPGWFSVDIKFVSQNIFQPCTAYHIYRKLSLQFTLGPLGKSSGYILLATASFL